MVKVNEIKGLVSRLPNNYPQYTTALLPATSYFKNPVTSSIKSSTRGTVLKTPLGKC